MVISSIAGSGETWAFAGADARSPSVFISTSESLDEGTGSEGVGVSDGGVGGGGTAAGDKVGSGTCEENTHASVATIESSEPGWTLTGLKQA